LTVEKKLEYIVVRIVSVFESHHSH